jgi:hypothetical protein
LNNRLTKSVFDASDAAMIGTPQPLNLFKVKYNGSSNPNIIPSLKNAVKKITNK